MEGAPVLVARCENILGSTGPHCSVGICKAALTAVSPCRVRRSVPLPALPAAAAALAHAQVSAPPSARSARSSVQQVQPAVGPERSAARQIDVAAEQVGIAVLPHAEQPGVRLAPVPEALPLAASMLAAAVLPVVNDYADRKNAAQAALRDQTSQVRIPLAQVQPALWRGRVATHVVVAAVSVVRRAGSRLAWRVDNYWGDRHLVPLPASPAGPGVGRIQMARPT